ncbi:KedN5 family methylcobalamin-dependent radical SAM C-methyltransferase [Micromonospora sp. CA-248089]|uniref:KedN5 family methylcobalamin-dependent radical SAM C-methyltransferase n=1 Tax=Micromonospora sp. CA-248089 TaxID=3239960 RepID=UPI003D933A7C
MPLESMPLAIGYMKAAVDADEGLRDEFETVIVNLRGATSIGTAVSAIFSETVPDVLAISVFGWNFREALVLAETFKLLKPDGLVVLGGTHVANQAQRVFRLCPEVDVVVNGEGELTFPELLHAWLAREFPEPGGHKIDGVSFRRADGTIVTTKRRIGVQDLGTIASPFLNGSIPMTDAAGNFRYDVAIMETNRGCPYHCAFCYWGGAIGQKIRRFPRERLIAEMEIFAFHKVNTVILCDANFGMQSGDEEFLEDVIKLREKTGYPRAIETSWAKNKSATFYRIVKRMQEAGLHSSFTIALQTLNDTALRDMNRRNMKLNDWKALAEWLSAEGLECYAELIWGAPGETTESFLQGYDELALHIPRIATYPLMILPNTDYRERREDFGLVTTRGQSDDFEYVLATNTMTFQENLAMQGFLLWARAVGENSFFRFIWRPLLRYAGLTQSQVLFKLAHWFDACSDETADPLKTPSTIVEPMAVNAAVRALFLDSRVRDLLSEWWEDEIRPVVKPEYQDLVDEVFRFDLFTLPIIDGQVDPALVEQTGLTRTYRRSAHFSVDVPAVVAALREGREVELTDQMPTTFDFAWRLGLEAYIDNHEEALLHMATIERVHPQQPEHPVHTEAIESVPVAG